MTCNVLMGTLNPTHSLTPYRGSNEIFVANIAKISTFNKDVLDSE